MISGATHPMFESIRRNIARSCWISWRDSGFTLAPCGRREAELWLISDSCNGSRPRDARLSPTRIQEDAPMRKSLISPLLCLLGLALASPALAAPPDEKLRAMADAGK